MWGILSFESINFNAFRIGVNIVQDTSQNFDAIIVLLATKNSVGQMMPMCCRWADLDHATWLAPLQQADYLLDNENQNKLHLKYLYQRIHLLHADEDFCCYKTRFEV